MLPYIPEELQTKITLMAYQLSPHPLATIIKESKTFYCERCVSLARLDFFDFLDDVPYKYIKFKNQLTYHNDVIVRFLPKPEGASDKLVRAVFKMELWNHIDDDICEIVQSRAWKSRTPFDYFVKDLINDVECRWSLNSVSE